MSRPRFGIVDYANVAPLVEGLARDGETLHRAVPAQLADDLAAGRVDVAMVPVIELGRLQGARLVPPWGIAADGPSGSVLLFTRVELAKVRSLRLDASSRTSAALTRILLARAGAGGVRLEQRAGGTVEERLDGCDATLLIGDPALRARAPEGVAVLDLSEEWRRTTGLPFTFAGWIARPGFPVDEATRARLDAAARAGLERLADIARREADRTGLPAARLERYYEGLDYQLGARHLEGLRAFLDAAWDEGLLPARATLELA